MNDPNRFLQDQDSPGRHDAPLPVQGSASPEKEDAARSSKADGVSSLGETSATPGGESGGAAYPHPERKKEDKGQFGTFMGHGGQTEIAYHGPGHLGKRVVNDDDNRNGVAEEKD